MTTSTPQLYPPTDTEIEDEVLGYLGQLPLKQVLIDLMYVIENLKPRDLNEALEDLCYAKREGWGACNVLHALDSLPKLIKMWRDGEDCREG